MRDFDPTASEFISSGYLETSRPGRGAKFHDPVSATVAAAGSLLGSSMQADASYSAAHDSAMIQQSSAADAANKQLQAAKIAADASRFRPVGITNTFGTSNFGFDSNGNLTSAGYTLSPELRKYQDYLQQQTGRSLQDTSGLLSLGRKYIGEDPNAVRQRYIDQQTALVSPQNEQALAGIRNNLFQTGRQGLATGATTAGGLAATNPEMAAYYNSLAQQKNQIAAGAEQAAQQQVAYGQGLLSSAYNPFQTALGLQGTVEQLGQDPMTLAANLGGRSMQGGAQAASALMQGGLSAANLQNTAAANAARTMQQANSFSPWGSTLSGLSNNPMFTQGLGKSISNWWNSPFGGTQQGAYGMQDAYMNSIGSSNTQQAAMLNEQMAGF